MNKEQKKEILETIEHCADTAGELVNDAHDKFCVIGSLWMRLTRPKGREGGDHFSERCNQLTSLGTGCACDFVGKNYDLTEDQTREMVAINDKFGRYSDPEKRREALKELVNSFPVTET